jgi:hypothetical protein
MTTAEGLADRVRRLPAGDPRIDSALARDGAGPMEQGTRTMKGFVWVERYALEHDDDLRDRLAFAERCAAAPAPK